MPPSYGAPQQPMQPPQQHMYQQSTYQNPYQQQAQQQYHQHQPLPPPPIQTQQAQAYYNTSQATPITGTGYYQQMQQQGALLSPQQLPPSSDPRAAPSGMFTRNLIGSLCVSAFKLTNPDGQMGVWFILQDLSVRTEGSFRYVSPLFVPSPFSPNPYFIPSPFHPILLPS